MHRLLVVGDEETREVLRTRPARRRGERQDEKSGRSHDIVFVVCHVGSSPRAIPSVARGTITRLLARPARRGPHRPARIAPASTKEGGGGSSSPVGSIAGESSVIVPSMPSCDDAVMLEFEDLSSLSLAMWIF